MNGFIEDNMELIANGTLRPQEVQLSGPGSVRHLGESGGSRTTPWKMTLSYTDSGGSLDAEASFSYCHLFIGGVIFKTFTSGVSGIDFSAATTGNHVVFLRLAPDRSIDAIDIQPETTVTGADRWKDTDVPSDGYTRIPLYLLTRTEATSRWAQLCDFRPITLGQYV